ncbi:MAG: PhoU domain-containing protein [Actinomycetota bacterium]
MVFEFFKGGDSTIDTVEATLVQMVRDGREVFDTAMDALFGGGKSKETKREIKSTDKGINVAQRDVRRELMIHASLHDKIDLPLVLAYMSTVKDVERIGDYSKNFYDLVKYGADFENAPDHEELAGYRNRVSALLDEAATTFEQRDTDRARELIAKADGFLDEHDAHVKAAYRSTGSPGDAVSRALYFRFLKRITAHVMNFLTSLVLPVDRLDYYDEAKDDRE